MKQNRTRWLVMLGASSSLFVGTVLTAAVILNTSDSESVVLNYTEKPNRIRTEERNQIKEESKKTEQVGREVERMRDAAEDSGEKVTTEELRERAEQKLYQAVQDFSGNTEEAVMQSTASSDYHPSEKKRVCFRSDGSVTDNREECDNDQGKHFGMPDKGEDIRGYGPPPQEFDSQMDHRFVPSDRPMMGPPILDIVADSLHRLSGAMEHVRGTDAEVRVREAIVWLSSVLADYASGEPEKDERIRLAQEIHMKLSELDLGFPKPPDMGPPGIPFEKILEEIDMIMKKISQVITIFEEAGIEIPVESRQAYEDARVLFEELRGPCKEDKQQCKRLEEIFEILENRMRPAMEKAIESSGNEEVMRRVEELMDEGMHQGPMPGPYPPGSEPYPMPGPYPMPMYPEQGQWEGESQWDPSCPQPRELDEKWEMIEMVMRSEMEASGESTEGDSRIWYEKDRFYLSNKCDDNGKRIPPEKIPPPYSPPPEGTYPSSVDGWSEPGHSGYDDGCNYSPQLEQEWEEIQARMKEEMEANNKSGEEMEEMLRWKKHEHFQCGGPVEYISPPVHEPMPVPGYDTYEHDAYEQYQNSEEGVPVEEWPTNTEAAG